MTRRNWLICFCLALCCPVSSIAQEKAPANTPPHAVILIKSDSPSDWQANLTKIDEFIEKAKPQKAIVEVVVARGGLKLVDKDSPMAAKVISLLEEKVEIVACKTSMDVNKMPLFRLLPGVGTVPGAGEEIETRKQLGWQQLEAVDTMPLSK